MPGEALVAYLVDTNVLSNRKDVATNSHLREWLHRNGGRLRVSVVTVAEMRRGLLLLETKLARFTDARQRRRERERLRRKSEWYAELVERFADWIEPIDLPVAERWAEISVRFPSLRDGDKAILRTSAISERPV